MYCLRSTVASQRATLSACRFSRCKLNIVIGIDPGAGGAIAFLNTKGELLDVVDMPIDIVRVGKSDKKVISPSRLVSILDVPRGSAVVYMERLLAMPPRGGTPDPLTGKSTGRMGATSTASFFRGGGVIEGICAAHGLPLTLVMPNKWKTAVSCPTGKDGARQRAAQQFPYFADKFTRVRDHDRAESALIALYGLRTGA